MLKLRPLNLREGVPLKYAAALIRDRDNEEENRQGGELDRWGGINIQIDRER